MFLLLVLSTGLLVAGFFLTPVETLLENEAARDAMGTDDVGEAADRILRSDEVKSAVKGLTGASDREAEYYLREKPALLSAILIVLLFLFPYVALAGFPRAAGAGYAAALVLLHACFGATVLKNRSPLWSSLLLPVSLVIFLFTIWRAIAITFRQCAAAFSKFLENE